MIERPQWYRPSAAARRLCSVCGKRCLGSLARVLREAGGLDRPIWRVQTVSCVWCMLQMLVCLVYASHSATPLMRRWAAGTPV